MKKRLLVLLVGILLTASACAWSLPEGDSGVIGMIPFVSQDLGVSGIAPVGWAEVEPGTFVGDLGDEEYVSLQQKSAPVTMDEVISVLLDQISLEELPEGTGTYHGAGLTWDLYTLDTQIHDAGEQVVWLKLAGASADSGSYYVILAALLDTYDANAPMLDALFTHVVDAFAPVDQSGQGGRSEG
jgi:hypothetical protein